jgi:O-6-methylguanine DNA methyltransferase
MGSGPPHPGEAVAYGELARHLGDGTTAQEVDAAVGRNPVCIPIPCHRVVGAGGKLTGFAAAWGVSVFFSTRNGTWLDPSFHDAP